jgi:hypothetical protein
MMKVDPCGMVPGGFSRRAIRPSLEDGTMDKKTLAEVVAAQAAEGRQKFLAAAKSGAGAEELLTIARDYNLDFAECEKTRDALLRVQGLIDAAVAAPAVFRAHKQAAAARSEVSERRRAVLAELDAALAAAEGRVSATSNAAARAEATLMRLKRVPREMLPDALPASAEKLLRLWDAERAEAVARRALATSRGAVREAAKQALDAAGRATEAARSAFNEAGAPDESGNCLLSRLPSYPAEGVSGNGAVSAW